MPANVEPKVLLAGPALAADRSLRRRLSGDYILQTAATIEGATAAMDRGDIDLVVGDYGGVAVYVGRCRHGLVFLHRILAAVVYKAAR